MTPLLHFDGVAKALGGRPVLAGLTFAVERGTVHALLGPNGSGKSTAIRIACGLLDADAGQVTIAGRPAAQAAPRLLGLCPQEPALYRDLHAAEVLDFFARLHGLSAGARRRRIDELVALFGLGPHRHTRIGQLSGGWQQRVSLAVALVHAPPLLVLDEPTAAVDVQARGELLALIASLRAAGTAMLLTTHHLDEAERLADRIGILAGGRLVAEGTPAQLLARIPARGLAIVETAEPPRLQARASALGWPVRRFGAATACLLPAPLTLREVADALDGGAVTSLRLQPVTLEHAYLDALGG